MSGSTEPYQPHRVRSDTPLYALTAVWYGPNGTLPPARYSTWAFGLAVTFAVFVAAIVVMPLDFMPRLVFAAGVAPGVGLITARRVFANIDYYMPLRAWIQVMRAEIDTPRPGRSKPTTHTLAPHRISR